MAIDYTDHDKVVATLKVDQEPEHDNRERAREAHYFVEKPDGQWEPGIISAMGNRPRYTFDLINPIIDQIAGEMDQADFDIRVRPAGGEASKENAITLDGLIRNIENMSNAQNVYMAGARDMIVSGIGGWEVVQDWAETDSFDQDLFIRPICDFVNRVWFDSGAELQDMSDANHVFVLQNLTKTEYESRFPKGGGQSVNTEKSTDAYTFKPDFVTVGRILYKKKTKKTLVRMSNGAVYEQTDDFKKVVNELKQQGITVKDERERDSFEVHSRLFDGSDWLKEDEKTVFQLLPVIPTFGNFRISDGKVIYRGHVEKLIDAQRVYNYSRSREIEEGALAPRAKYWMTEAQAAGHEGELETLNTNADPVQFFNPDEENPGPPQQSGGAAINPGLTNVSASMSQQIQQSAGLFGLNQGDLQQGNLSGVAIQSIQNKGDNATIKYFTSQEVAICQTARVLVNAAPKVYDSERMIRVLGEDGVDEMVKINEKVFDNETQEFSTLNDLTVGKYDVTCDVGPAFKNRQQETIKAFQELATVIPGLAEITADIQLKNIPTPGMDLAAERVRQRLFQSNLIPESQMTDEEKEQLQQAQQQPKEPSPEDVIAKAEEDRVRAETADTISKTQERAKKLELQELTLALKKQSQDVAHQNELIKANIDGQKQIFEVLNLQAQTLKTLREASGVDAITGPHVIESFVQQAETITDQQDAIQATPETDEVTR